MPAAHGTDTSEDKLADEDKDKDHTDADSNQDHKFLGRDRDDSDNSWDLYHDPSISFEFILPCDWNLPISQQQPLPTLVSANPPLI